MPAARPCLSIGLPVYNGEPFLTAALDSILDQTFRDFELIISDNGSTDATAEICEAYAARDSRIRYYRSDVNRGASWNFNRVFALSSGEYFKWSAADDVIAPTFLEQCRNVMEADPGVVLVYPKSVCIDESGEALEDYDSIMSHRQWSPDPATQFRQVLEEFEFNGGASANVYNFGLIRRSALKKTRLLGNYIMADCNVVSALALLGRFHELSEHLLFLRAHPGSSSWFEGATWSFEKMQNFFDPAVKGRMALAMSIRKHHFEHARAVWRSPLSMRAKAGLMLYCTRPPLRILRKNFDRAVMGRLRLALH
jgi:glycosyltransferase involved in cell wall biosynthesis